MKQEPRSGAFRREQLYMCEHVASLAGILVTYIRYIPERSPTGVSAVASGLVGMMPYKITLKIHSRKKFYKCEHCGKSFNQSIRKQVFKLWHMLMQNCFFFFICIVRFKMHFIVSNLRRRIHSGVGPDKCQKVFL